MTVPSRDERGAADGTSKRLAGRFDPSSWAGALALMAVAVGVLWTVQIVNMVDDYSLNRFGLKPREADGLIGVVAMPFLHANVSHLISNSIPFIMIGWLVLIGGWREFVWSTLIIVVVGGFATWLVAPAGVIVGASGLIFGWLGYLLGRAYFARKLSWIVAAVFAVFFFASLFGALLPDVHTNVAWPAHLCGLAAGIGAAWLLHPRAGSTRALRRAAAADGRAAAGRKVDGI